MATAQARTSVRYSTYSVAAPSFQSNDSAQNEIRDIATGLERMENRALTSQRVMLNEEKADNFRKLALGAKLDRALGRRMTSQDAVMRPRKHKAASTTTTIVDEKQQLVEKVA